MTEQKTLRLLQDPGNKDQAEVFVFSLDVADRAESTSALSVSEELSFVTSQSRPSIKPPPVDGEAFTKVFVVSTADGGGVVKVCE